MLRGARENVSSKQSAWEHRLLQDGGKATSATSTVPPRVPLRVSLGMTLVTPGFARMSTAAMATSVAYHLYNSLRKCHEGTEDCFLTTIKNVAKMRRKLIITNNTDR